MPGIEAHRDAGARRRRQQQVAQVGAEDPNRFLFGHLAQPLLDVVLELGLQARLPRERDGRAQEVVGRAALVGDAGKRRDAALRFAERGAAVVVGQDDRQLEDAFLAAAQQREDAMRRQLVDRLAGVEVVAELRALLLLALDHRGPDRALFPHVRAQAADQFGRLREPLDEDGAGAIERRGDVEHAGRLVDVLGRRLFGHERRRREQRVGKRLESLLARHLGLRSLLRAVRRVEVLETRLAVGAADRVLELRRELLLLDERGQDRRAALLELAQVAQALLERTQLRVVEPAGRLLAVARDEGHGGAFVEQRHGGRDLARRDGQFLGDPIEDRREHDRRIGRDIGHRTLTL